MALPFQGDSNVFDLAKTGVEEKELEEFLDQEDRRRFLEHSEGMSECPACGLQVPHITAWAIDHGFLTCKDHNK